MKAASMAVHDAISVGPIQAWLAGHGQAATGRPGTLRGAPWAAPCVSRASWMASALLACGVLSAPLGGAWARDSALGFVTSDQGDTSRITLDAPKGVAARVEAAGDSITIRLPKGMSADTSSIAGPMPRRFVAILPLADGVRIFAAAGSQLRHHRAGDRIVIEATDAETAEASPAGGFPLMASAPRGGAEVRLAALGGRTASDAPALLPGAASAIAALPPRSPPCRRGP